ncbi:MFS transporter [Acinetobacter stercoris]|uniref:Alpha-ketoglutarate permease n=1 Tax=Acinetobacter stercoris TaxID=2126983 RepID=A0A2U3N0Q0_9GAMM|nr:MFS transporter [Acinetobacter stercoris]SPL71195.1 Alpha-ketoglutarate permease [Acinetobacter stercoris]
MQQNNTVVLNQHSPDKRTRIKSILGGSAGNLVEWYDWFAYSMFTLYFAKSFFPAGNQTVELLQAAAVFAVGFLMRPIGAWMMGIFADRRGRKAGLTLSVTLMCIGSLLIACAPTYESVGVFAPIVLIIARLLQGLSVGGEYGASATYLSEMAGKNRRGLFSSFQYMTIMAGQLLALFTLIILQQVLTDQQLTDWGWRIPFFIGAILALLVFVIRRGMVETESFKNVNREKEVKSSAFALFRYHPKAALAVIFLTAGGTLSFYAYTTYMQKFLVNTSGFSKETATMISAAAIFVFMCIQPLVGHISDKVGRKAVMIFFGVGGVLFTYPVFTLIANTTNAVWALSLIIFGMIFVAGYTATGAVIKSELFPSHIRALGVALPYAIANTIFGGTSELAALQFKNIGHENYYFIYVSVMCFICLIYFIKMKDQKQHSLILED